MLLVTIRDETKMVDGGVHVQYTHCLTRELLCVFLEKYRQGCLGVTGGNKNIESIQFAVVNTVEVPDRNVDAYKSLGLWRSDEFPLLIF